jgi:PelA/Pel-15E family pectate lyase
MFNTWDRKSRFLAGLGFWMMALSAGVAGAASVSARLDLANPPEWFRTPEAASAAANILSYQAANGGFPKNIDTAAGLYTGDPDDLLPTFDNSATTDELRFLGHIYAATQIEKYRVAFLKGVDYVLVAQYPTGGWPQSYPPGHNDYDHYITYNDGAMARLMFFLKEISEDPTYSFLDDDRRARCKQAWDRGVQCILKCQIRVNGKVTAWCQQHDEFDFSPRPGRTFEPVALTTNESVGITHVLMNDEHPTPQIIAAVDAAVAWLKSVTIYHTRVDDRPQKDTPRGFERFIIYDPSAPPIWARYYEIGTNRPIFVGRDGIVRYDLSEIEIERRTGYQWYKYWPRDLVNSQYAVWKAKIAAPATQPSVPSPGTPGEG